MKEAYTDMLAEFTTKNNASLVELVKKHNVVLKRFPDAVLKKMGELSKVVVEEVANKDPLSKKVYDSFNEYRAQSIEWANIGEVGYSLARALTFKS